MRTARVTRRQVLAALALGGVFPSFAACDGTPTGPLRVGCNSWPGYAPLFLAADMGYLPRGKFRIISLPSATEVQRALENGLLDAAAVTLDEALRLKARGMAIKIVLVTDVSHGGDAIVARPWFETTKALRGRRIGVEGTALGAYMLGRALELAGLSPGDVEAVQLTLSEHEAAFLNGSVDAVVTFDPVRSRLLRGGAREIFTSRDIPGEVVDVVVVPESILAAREDVLSDLAAGWFRALDHVWRDQAEAARIMAPYLGLDPRETLSALGRMHLPDRGETVVLLGGGPGSLASVLVRMRDIMAGLDYLDRDTPVQDMLDARAVRRGME
jgi:NitT/TauT family transport system substrate-binding protein